VAEVVVGESAWESVANSRRAFLIRRTESCGSWRTIIANTVPQNVLFPFQHNLLIVREALATLRYFSPFLQEHAEPLCRVLCIDVAP
jgi:hypothetical protein